MLSAAPFLSIYGQHTVTQLNDALAARFTAADEIKDIARYGCSGGVSGFIYNNEIADFFNEYEDDIENEIAGLGYDIKDLVDTETNSVMGLINKMVWLVVEDYCQCLIHEMEEAYDNDISENAREALIASV